MATVLNKQNASTSVLYYMETYLSSNEIMS